MTFNKFINKLLEEFFEYFNNFLIIQCTTLPECLLSSRVPNLQFNLFTINSNHTSAKLNSNGQIMHGLKTLVGELKK